MAFTNSTNKIATKTLIKKIDAKLSGRVSTNEVKIDRVLEGQGRVAVSNLERVGDGLQVSGSVVAELLYINSDKQLSCETLVLDYSERVRLSGAEELFVLPRIKDIKLTMESDSQISAGIVVEFAVFGVVYDEVQFVSGVDEGCHTTTREVEINQLVASTNTNFSLSTQLEMPDNAKYLTSNALTSVTSVVAHQNYVEIEGSTVLDIWVQEGEQFKKVQKTVDFNEEIPLLNSQEGFMVDFAFYDRAINISEEDKVADINIGVALWVMESSKTTIIDDAFSEKEVLDLTISNFDNVELEPVRIFSERKTVIVDTASKKRVDEILFVGAIKTEIDQASNAEMGIAVEGSLSFPIIYKNYDNDDIISTTLSAPFDIVVSTEIKDEQDVENFVHAELSARVNGYKNKAGKEISMVVDFEGQINCFSIVKEQYVEKLEKKEQITRKKSSIIVYKPKENESVFNIAKTLKISPDILLAQNPQLENENSCDQVVIYTKF